MEIENIKKAMLECQLSKISCEYSGEGDSGNIDSVDLFDTRGNSIAETTKKYDFTTMIWDFIMEYHAGFEINDGGSGEINFVLKDGELKVSWVHRDYYTESNITEHSLTA